jgi:hypothetical protein
MDRTFGAPRDVSNATPDDVARALDRVLRTLARPARFIYAAEYEFQNKRRGPLLMIGELRGPWREYVRRNASSPRFAAGTCTVRRDEDGRIVLELAAERGRATGSAHERAINAGPMRRIGQARFVEAAATPAAEPEETAGTAPQAAAAARAPQAAPAPAAADILARFAAFKAGPTAEGLEQLLADIDAWRAARTADPGAAPEPAAAQIEKLGALLAQKGRAYLAAKSG